MTRPLHKLAEAHVDFASLLEAAVKEKEDLRIVMETGNNPLINSDIEQL